AASWLGGRPYPLQRLNDAWTLVMGGQFHDILPGTATPKSFEYAWNDDIVAMNQFAGVLSSATDAVSSALDTQAQGTPIVVYNALKLQREDGGEARIHFQNGTPRGVPVTGPNGREVPAQLGAEKDGAAKVIFLAKAPSVGYAVFDVQPSDSPAASSELKASES